MTAPSATARPDYIGSDWFRCTVGMSFLRPPPQTLLYDSALDSANPWERLVCVTMQSQGGDFRHTSHLLELAHHGADDHLRDCAINVYALSASSRQVASLSGLFTHPDYDTRIEAYAAAATTGSLELARALAAHRACVSPSERESVMVSISDLLEADVEPLLFADSLVDDGTYQQQVSQWSERLQRTHGPAAILAGELLSPQAIMTTIERLCSQNEPECNGGTIARLFVLLEGLTGWPYAGCIDVHCAPVLPQIALTLGRLRESGLLDRLKPGRRYFFGHPLA